MGEGCFRVLGSEEVDCVHAAIFIDYLCEVTFESRLRRVWSSYLDSLPKRLETLLFPKH